MNYKIYLDERNIMGKVPVRGDNGNEITSFDPDWPMSQMSYVMELLSAERSITRSNTINEIKGYLRDLIVRDISEGDVNPETEDAVNLCYDYIYESITRTITNLD